MLTSLHHIALAVRDLPSVTQRFTALLGREFTWYGSYSGVRHASFRTDNIALEIIAPDGTGAEGDRARTHLDQHGEGIWNLAFATSNIATARHVLQRRGIASTSERLVCSTHFESSEQRIWTTSELAKESTFGVGISLLEPASFANHSNARAAFGIGLDHVVVYTSHPERAAALYGARLGLELKLDRTNPDWGSRLLFFKCGDLVVEIAHSLKNSDVTAPDKAWGLSWHVADVAAANKRLANEGFNVSDVRVGRKPGTQVFTVRDAPANVPTIVMGKTNTD